MGQRTDYRASPAHHKDGNASLTDLAHAELRRQIISLRLPPGARFSESQLTQSLGMGKTPIREALARLIERGLVVPVPRVGYLVAPITLQDVHQICELRLMLEREAVRLAIGRANMKVLRELDERCVLPSTDGGDDETFVNANHEFHLALASASGNSRLAEVMDHLLDQSDRLYRVGLMLDSGGGLGAHKHESLLHSIEEGDARSAMNIVARQIRDFRLLVMDALMVTPSILTVPLTSASTETRALMSASSTSTNHGRDPGSDRNGTG
jgi:DNA-binding GntR family transcriptional regulator